MRRLDLQFKSRHYLSVILILIDLIIIIRSGQADTLESGKMGPPICLMKNDVNLGMHVLFCVMRVIRYQVET